MKKILISIVIQIHGDQDREITCDHGDLRCTLEQRYLGHPDVAKHQSGRVDHTSQHILGAIAIHIGEHNGTEGLIYRRGLVQGARHGTEGAELIPATQRIRSRVWVDPEFQDGPLRRSIGGLRKKSFGPSEQRTADQETDAARAHDVISPLEA